MSGRGTSRTGTEGESAVAAAAHPGSLRLPPGLVAAVRLLTIVPLPRSAPEDARARAASLPWFPVVGLALGASALGALLLPLPAVPAAALALALWTVLTGGLHEDGFLDCADAALAPAPPERRIEILKDPRVGAHAVTAGGLLLLLRFAALTWTPAGAALVAPVVGRWCMTLTLASPAARPGLGAAYASAAPSTAPSLVALFLLGTLALVPPSGVAALPAAAAVLGGLGTGWASARFLAARLGGASGDVHGAAGLLAETAALWAYGVLA